MLFAVLGASNAVAGDKGCGHADGEAAQKIVISFGFYDGGVLVASARLQTRDGQAVDSGVMAEDVSDDKSDFVADNGYFIEVLPVMTRNGMISADVSAFVSRSLVDRHSGKPKTPIGDSQVKPASIKTRLLLTCNKEVSIPLGASPGETAVQRGNHTKSRYILKMIANVKKGLK